eukprot:scaffold11512_cov63-Phaeocystis_antarctica.AAC.2
MLGGTHATSGRAAVAMARSVGRALKQERCPELRSGDVSVACARGCWPSCAYGMASLSPNIVEDHHEGVLHAACGRSRVPGVMSTTLRANAQELQVSTTVEENAGDASACGSRAASSQTTIASALEKLQPAL